MIWANESRLKALCAKLFTMSGTSAVGDAPVIRRTAVETYFSVIIQDAANAYQQAVKLRLNGVEALGNLAIVLHENDDLDRAREAYERVLELDPGHAGTLWNLALLYHRAPAWDRPATWPARFLSPSQAPKHMQHCGRARQ